MMSLREKYQEVITVAQQASMQGLSIDESGGKLNLKGTVQTVPDKNRIWNAIKAIGGWEQEVVADIRVSDAGMAAWQNGGQTTATTYTVKPGDTLSKIAREHLGDANAYMEIYNANRDQLQDPDKIKPGQVLKIPQMAKH